MAQRFLRKPRTRRIAVQQSLPMTRQATGITMRMQSSACCAVIVALLVSRAASQTADKIKQICESLPNKTIVIGMITKGNVELTLQRWNRTFENYLTTDMTDNGYGCKTRLVPLGFDDYDAAIANKDIDVFFPNPTAFQEMKDKYNIKEFLSVTRKFGDNQRLDRFGGVIVRAASKYTDIIEVADILKYSGLQRLKICGVNENAFGGWHIQWYEMIKAGIDVYGDHEPVFPGKHELAIEQTVVSGECDIGVARTETVERLVEAGVFNESDVFTIGDQGAENDFPQHLTTELYPEWPLASLAHVPREIEQIIAVPLLNLKSDSVEANLGDFFGFSFPYSYQPVEDMFIAIDKEGTGRCYSGMYREGSNPGTCFDCPAGTFSEDGMGACAPCPVGTVNNGTRNVDCFFCPLDLTTHAEGSVDGECVELEEPEEVPWMTIVVSVTAVLALLLLGLSVVACRRVYRQYREALRAAREEEASKRKRLKDGVLVMQQFQFPLCVMRFTDFISMDKLVPHEFARNNKLLLWFDLWHEAMAFAEQETIMFVSHQWLDIASPDPEGTHFRSMVASGEALCREQGIEAESLYVWVDYHSIPQACPASKMAAINSIMVYASCSKYFVAVAPEATHITRQERADSETYRRRGWCRLEQWAFMINGGTYNMFLFEGAERDKLKQIDRKQGWFEDMINVMSGDFSVDSDRWTLVDVILGLYGFALVCDKDIVARRGAVSDSEMTTTKTNRSTPSVDRAASSKSVNDSLAKTMEKKQLVFSEHYFKGLDRKLEREIDIVMHGMGNDDPIFTPEELEKLIGASRAFTRIHADVYGLDSLEADAL